MLLPYADTLENENVIIANKNNPVHLNTL